MKKVVIQCAPRLAGDYIVVIADTCGGRNQRLVYSDKPVPVGSDVRVHDDRVVHP